MPKDVKKGLRTWNRKRIYSTQDIIRDITSGEGCGKFECRICGATYKNLYDITKHVPKKHAKKVEKLLRESEGRIDQHGHGHASSSNTQGLETNRNVGQKVTPSKGTNIIAIDDLLQVGGPNEFQCKICGKTLESIKSIKIHISKACNKKKDLITRYYKPPPYVDDDDDDDDGDADKGEWAEMGVETVECLVPLRVYPGNTAFRALEVVFEV